MLGTVLSCPLVPTQAWLPGTSPVGMIQRCCCCELPWLGIFTWICLFRAFIDWTMFSFSEMWCHCRAKPNFVGVLSQECSETGKGTVLYASLLEALWAALRLSTLPENTRNAWKTCLFIWLLFKVRPYMCVLRISFFFLVLQYSSLVEPA